MLITYLLLSYLLSIVGFTLYQYFLKPNIQPKHGKYAIYAVLAISLLVPSFLVQQPVPFEEQVAKAEQQFPFVNEPKLDTELAECYDKVSNEEGFCHCETLQASNLLYYKPNKFYDGLLKAQTPILWIFGGISLLLFLQLFIKIGFLLHLKRHSQIEIREVEGRFYRLLKTDSSMLAASFTLIHQYIVWHPSLDALSDEEQQAVLLHEISHLKNRDTWEEIGLSLLQIFWLLNPVFYILKKELGLLNEFIADNFALQRTGNPKAYAHLLLKLKEQQQVGYAAQFGGSALTQRIMALIQPKQFIKSQLVLPILSGICFLMLATGFGTAPTVNEQHVYFEEYKILNQEHTSTGKDSFCKPCLYQDLYGIEHVH